MVHRPHGLHLHPIAFFRAAAITIKIGRESALKIEKAWHFTNSERFLSTSLSRHMVASGDLVKMQGRKKGEENKGRETKEKGWRKAFTLVCIHRDFFIVLSEKNSALLNIPFKGTTRLKRETKNTNILQSGRETLALAVVYHLKDVQCSILALRCSIRAFMHKYITEW